MVLWRNLASLVVFLFLVPCAWSQTVTLAEELKAGDCFAVRLEMNLAGEITVAKGDSWKVKNSVAQALCNFEGLTEQDLTCKLDGADDKTATVSVTGAATGIDLGAQVQLKIEATYRFDLTAKRLVELEWKQKDERDLGPANPASKIEVTT